MAKCILNLFFAVLLFCSFLIEAKKPVPSVPTKFAFGSCNKQHKPQPQWDLLREYDPDFWIWLGDVVYADKDVFPSYMVPSDLEHVQKVFNQQKQNANYSKFVESTTVVGHWDDHDFNCNNCGKNYKDKDAVKKMFLDFIDEPANSTRRTQQGLYKSYTFGDKNHAVKVILLDTRYFADRVNGDILGPIQWAWLRKELETSKNAKMTIITSGIQIMPTQKVLQEKWLNFDKSRKKIFKLIAEMKTRNVIMLSGDVHYAEIFKNECTAVNYPLYEITSSGMTHCCGQLPFNACSTVLSTVFRDEYRLTPESFYEYFNYGTVELEWQGTELESIELQIRNAKNGTLVLSHVIKTSELTPSNNFTRPEYCDRIENNILYYRTLVLDDFRNIGLTAIGISFIAMIAMICVARKAAKQPARLEEPAPVSPKITQNNSKKTEKNNNKENQEQTKEKKAKKNK